MKADLSRGHKPDQKRGQKYRRVLLQQGRLLLDSDVAAMSDALDAENRDLGRYTAGAAGSPDLGFLITPGRLLAFFDSLEPVTPGQSNDALFRYHLDYTRKYLSRLASLYMGAQLGDGALTVELRHALPQSSVLRLWARIPAGTVLSVQFDTNPTPVDVNGTGANTFELYELTPPAGSASYGLLTFQITAAADSTTKELWIGLIEEKVPAASAPNFWVKEGRYLLDGLSLDLEADGLFPGVSFEDPITGSTHGDQIDGTVNPGDLFLAYLEGWERLITSVEDPGVLERALGGSIDTCARSRVAGQVKLARCSGLSDADAILKSFGTLKSPAGTLSIGEATQTASQDPCAIPEVEGYSGSDNRLYRFEVHKGGGLGDFEIKWSRNNGADLYRVLSIQTSGGVSRLTLSSGIDLRDGDLVEFLGETAELGDGAPGSVDGAGFTPAERAVGSLYYVREVPEAPGQIELFDDNLNASVLLSADLAAQSIPKLRRWHGVLKPPAGNTDPVVFTVDGIEVTIDDPSAGSDSFRPGDYWQYEARRLYANDNGTFDESPHGPERVFAALALLKFNGASEPLELVRWYDGPFSPLGDVKADHIAYYDGRANPTAHTVQDAIDELFARHDDGCCYVDMEALPNPVDDAVRIIDLIQTELPTGGVICLRPGVYWLRSQITITNMRLEIRGCPDAVLVSDANGQTPIVVGAGGELTLSGFVYCTSGSNPGPALIGLSDDARLSVKECGLFHVGPSTGYTNPGTAIVTSDSDPHWTNMDEPTYVLTYPLPSEPTMAAAPTITLEECVVIADWCISAGNLKALTLKNSTCYAKSTAIFVKQLSSLDVSGSALAGVLSYSHFDTLRQEEPAAMAQHARDLLESLDLTSIQGTAFYGLEIFGGTVTDSLFSGVIGFFAQFARDLHLRGNQYRGGCGIRLDNVERCTVLNEDIIVGPLYIYCGIEVVRSAIDFTISDCVIQCLGGGSDYGIVLATKLPSYGNIVAESLTRRFHGVLVSNNHIRCSWTALLFRNAANTEVVDPSDPSFDHVVVHGNHIDSSRYGIRCGTDLDYEVTVSSIAYHMIPRLLIADNVVNMRDEGSACMGVFLQNVNFAVLRRNHVIVAYHTSQVGYNHGIYAENSNGVSIEENVVDVDGGMSAALPSNAYTIGIVLFQTSSVSVARNIITTHGTARSWSINYSTDLTVEGNVATYSYYKGELFSVGNVVVRNNRLRCGLHVSLTVDGVICDNIIENLGDSEPVLTEAGTSIAGTHLFLENVEGSWQIQGNRVADHIALWTRYSSPTEAVVTLQVQGNQSLALTIGQIGPSGGFSYTASFSSRVMVTGNMAASAIKVNYYSKLLYANNMAPTLLLGASSVGSTGNLSANNTTY